MAALPGHFTGLHRSWKLILSFGLLLSSLSISSSMEIKVNGPDKGLAGDFELFACSLEGDDVDSKTEVDWKYKLKNGEITATTESDRLSALEYRSGSAGKLSVSSFIRLSSPDVVEIICQHSAKTFGVKPVEIGDIKAVTPEEDPCTMAESAGKPVIIMQTGSLDFVPPYRMARSLNGESVEMVYPTEVSQVQVTCVTYGTSDPIWTLKANQASNLKYAVWAMADLKDTNCKKQTLKIYEVRGKSGDAIKFTPQCGTSSSKSAPVDITFKYADIPMTRNVDFNRTEECVNEVVEQFYNKELTGVGVASSFVIILMMAGMAVLKKQLNQQQNINKDLGGGGPGPAPQGNAGTSGGNIA